MCVCVGGGCHITEEGLHGSRGERSAEGGLCQKDVCVWGGGGGTAPGTTSHFTYRHFADNCRGLPSQGEGEAPPWVMTWTPHPQKKTEGGRRGRKLRGDGMGWACAHHQS